MTYPKEILTTREEVERAAPAHLSRSGLQNRLPDLGADPAWQAELTDERGLAEVGRARAYIRSRRPRKTLNRRRSSYGWKHEAEKWAGAYVSNGAMIAAAHLERLTIQQIGWSLNALLSLSDIAREPNATPWQGTPPRRRRSSETPRET